MLIRITASIKKSLACCSLHSPVGDVHVVPLADVFLRLTVRVIGIEPIDVLSHVGVQIDPFHDGRVASPKYGS